MEITTKFKQTCAFNSVWENMPFLESILHLVLRQQYVAIGVLASDIKPVI